MPQISLRSQILDRVVHQHRVEGPTQAQRTHVALDVLALRIRTLTEREHARREVDERCPDSVLVVKSGVPRARAQLQECPRRRAGRFRRTAPGRWTHPPRTRSPTTTADTSRRAPNTAAERWRPWFRCCIASPSSADDRRDGCRGQAVRPALRAFYRRGLRALVRVRSGLLTTGRKPLFCVLDARIGFCLPGGGLACPTKSGRRSQSTPHQLGSGRSLPTFPAIRTGTRSSFRSRDSSARTRRFATGSKCHAAFGYGHPQQFSDSKRSVNYASPPTS